MAPKNLSLSTSMAFVVGTGLALSSCTKASSLSSCPANATRAFTASQRSISNTSILRMNASDSSKGAKMEFPIKKINKPAKEITESDWKTVLSEEEFYVMRNKGTEYPGTGEYNKFYPKEGYFACAACGNPLYSAQSKFDSGCGWPAYDKAYEGAIKIEVDNAHGMRRVEIMCNGLEGTCGAHLGHVFSGERFTPTNERHCVNSVSVKYVPEAPAEPKKEVKVVQPVPGESAADIATRLRNVFGL